MQYLGGKSRIAKPLSEILIAAGEGCTTYVEPFLGAASVFALVAPAFPRAVGGEVVEDLALLWQAVQAGWEPPTELSEEQYAELRTAAPSPLRAVAGFGCSFGGKWFGGYARDPRKKVSFAETFRNGIARRSSGMAAAEIRHTDYRGLDELVGPKTLVYCDPPYASTTSYGAAPPFDSEEFFRVASRWSARGARVFVSEYAAPPPWRSIWQSNPSATLAGGTAGRVTERLFAHPSTLERLAP